MTTIVCNREGMCADKRVTGGTMFKTSKIHRVNGGLIGYCGHIESALKFIEWRKNPDTKPEYEEKNWEALELTADGRLLWWGAGLIPIEIEDEYYAVGSGSGYALGAMSMGATLQQAIKIAATYDPGTGPDVQSLKLGTKK